MHDCMTKSAQQTEAAISQTSDLGKLFPGLEMLSWLPLFGLLLMGVNDCLIRQHHSNWITGKLSDFAVVVYFPFLVTSVVQFATLVLDKLLCHISPGRTRLNWGFTKKKLAVGKASAWI